MKVEIVLNDGTRTEGEATEVVVTPYHVRVVWKDQNRIGTSDYFSSVVVKE